MKPTPRWRKRAALYAIAYAHWLDRRSLQIERAAHRAVDLARRLAPAEFAAAEELAALAAELEEIRGRCQPAADYDREERP